MQSLLSQPPRTDKRNPPCQTARMPHSRPLTTLSGRSSSQPCLIESTLDDNPIPSSPIRDILIADGDTQIAWRTSSSHSDGHSREALNRAEPQRGQGALKELSMTSPGPSLADIGVELKRTTTAVGSFSLEEFWVSREKKLRSLNPTCRVVSELVPSQPGSISKSTKGLVEHG